MSEETHWREQSAAWEEKYLKAEERRIVCERQASEAQKNAREALDLYRGILDLYEKLRRDRIPQLESENRYLRGRAEIRTLTELLLNRK